MPFGIRPDHPDSTLQRIDNSHASFRPTRDRLLEDEQQMSKRLRRAGIIAERRLKNDLPGFSIGEQFSAIAVVIVWRTHFALHSSF